MVMESFRRSQLDPVQADDSGSFGVKVQVQGIAGRPYVVLNAQGTRVPRSPDYPDVFLMEQQRQEFVSSMSGGASSAQTPPPDHYRSLRTFRNPLAAQMLNYQKNPEILRPYDPRSGTVSGRGWFSSPSSPVMVKRARIPLPGAGFTCPSVENVPCQPSHIICRLSVPGSGGEVETNHTGSPRTGRVAHRSRITPEEKRRSRSLESRSTSSVPGTSAVGTKGPDVKAEVTGVDSTSADVRSEVKEETERTAQVEKTNCSNESL